MGAVGFSPEQLEIELTWIDEHVDGKPYGVDTVIPAKYVGRNEGDFGPEQLAKMVPDSHVEFINELLEKHEVPALPENIDEASGFVGWS